MEALTGGFLDSHSSHHSSAGLPSKKRRLQVLPDKQIAPGLSRKSVFGLRIRKPVPSAYNMKCALKLVSVSQFLFTPSTTSYDVDDAQYPIDMLSTGMQEQVAAETEAIDDSEIPFVEELTSAERDILFHIGGFLIKGILKSIGHCEKCKPALLGSSSSDLAYLTSLKEYVCEGQPSLPKRCSYARSQILRGAF